MKEYRSRPVHRIEVRQWLPLVFLAISGLVSLGKCVSVDPTQTIVWGTGIEEAGSGEPASFYVQNRDSAGQNVSGAVTGDAVQVECYSAPDKPKDFCEQNPVYEFLGGGLWRVTYTVGTIWAEFTSPYFLPPSPDPLPDNYFTDSEDRLIIHAGDPLVEVPGSPFRPALTGDSTLVPFYSYVDVLSERFPAGMVRQLALFNEMKDRFANTVRPNDALQRLEGKLELDQIGQIGPNAQSRPPVITASWLRENWYMIFDWTCYTVGHYKLEILYKIDAYTSERVRLYTSNGMVQQANVTCSPGKLDPDNFFFDHNPPNELRAGETAAAKLYALDTHGNSAYLLQSYSWWKWYGIANQTLDVLDIELEHEGCGCQDGTLSFELDAVVPGLVHVTLQSTRAGKHLLRVLYNSIPINGPPFEIWLAPWEPDPSHSSVDISEEDSAVFTVVAGSDPTIPILLRDQYDNPAEGIDALLKATAVRSGDSSNSVIELTSVEYIGDGVYKLSLSGLTVAGDYVLSVSYNDEVIQNGLQSVTVVHSPLIDAYYSDVAGTGIGLEVGGEAHLDKEEFQQPAGRNLSLIVQAADPFGNPHQHSYPDFQLNQDFQDASVYMEAFVNGDGTVRFQYIIERVGIYYLRVSTPQNETLYQSNLEIVPAGVKHTSCEVFGFSNVVAGEEGVGYLKISDRFDNTYRNADQTDISSFSVVFRHDDEPYYAPGVDAVIGVFDSGRQGNRVSFSLTREGTYTMTAKWARWPIPGSSGQLHVYPGQIYPPNCRLMSSVQPSFTAGAYVVVQVQGYDRFGNQAKRSDIAALVDVSFSGSQGNPETTFSVLAVDGEPWKANIKVKSHSVGDFVLSVRVNGTEVDGSPLRGLHVKPATFDPLVSNITGEGTKTAYVGVWNEVTISPRDEFGNVLQPGSLNGLLELDVRSSAPVQSTQFPETGASVHYTARYLPTEKGTYVVTVLHERVVLPGFPINIEAVYPGEVPSADCRWGILGQPNCGDHGELKSCKCVCDDGWTTDVAGQSLINITYCNKEVEQEAEPPLPAIEFDEDGPLEGPFQYAVLALMAVAILSLAATCWCCCRGGENDGSSDASDSEMGHSARPTLHGGLLSAAVMGGEFSGMKTLPRLGASDPEDETIPAYRGEGEGLNPLWGGGGGDGGAVTVGPNVFA